MTLKRITALLVLLAVLCTCCVSALAETSFSFLGDISWSTSQEEANTTLTGKPYKFAAIKKYTAPDGMLVLSKGKIDKQTYRYIGLDFSGDQLNSICLYSVKSSKVYKSIVALLDKCLGKHTEGTLARDFNDGERTTDYPALVWSNEDTQAYLYGMEGDSLTNISKGKAAFYVLIARADTDILSFQENTDEFRTATPDNGEEVEDTWNTTYSGTEQRDLSSMFSTSTANTTSYQTASQLREEEAEEAQKQAVANGEVETGKVILSAGKMTLKDNTPNLTLTVANRNKEQAVVSVTVQLEFLSSDAMVVPGYGVKTPITVTYTDKIKAGKSAKVTYAATGFEGATSFIAEVVSYTLEDGTTVEIPEADYIRIYKVKSKK